MSPVLYVYEILRFCLQNSYTVILSTIWKRSHCVKMCLLQYKVKKRSGEYVCVLNRGNCIPTLLQEERQRKTYNSFYSFLCPVSFKMNIIWISVDWFHVSRQKFVGNMSKKLPSDLLSNSDMATAIFCFWPFSLILRADTPPPPQFLQENLKPPFSLLWFFKNPTPFN